MANTLRGVEIKTAVPDEAMVMGLRSARRAGATYSLLSSRFGISRTQAYRIVHGECWAHLSGEAIERDVTRDELVRRVGDDGRHLRSEQA